jgi:hypothetical protein
MPSNIRSLATRAAALVAIAALVACSDAPFDAAPVEDPLLARIAELGFRTDMVEDRGDWFLIEGDIRLEKADLRRPGPVADPSGIPGPLFQYRTTALVGSPRVHQIRVDLSGLNAQPAWQAAAREALTHWSGIPNSYVRMVEGTPAEISVGTTCTSSNVAAFASWPSGGNPGSTVTVNTCFGWALDHAQRVHNMVHEFGHTIGFRHTNYAQMGESAGSIGAVHVPGTPTSGNDPGSVMNGGTALNGWAGFSFHDRGATVHLYPLPAPAPWTSSVGSTPQVAWSALVGAQGYTVTLHRTDEVYNSMGQVISSTTQVFPVGTTTGTSILDSGRTHTGVSRCYDGTNGIIMDYLVQATFPTGNRTGAVAAPVANCSQLGEEDQ